MAKLVFDAAELEPILQHAAKAETTGPSFGQLCDKQYWKPGAVPNDFGCVKSDDIDKSKLPKAVLIVADQGVYLMSAGEPGLRTEVEGKSQHVVTYAKGYNPERDEDWYDKKRYNLGGDDFGEPLPVGMFAAAARACPGFNEFVVTINTRTIRVEARISKRKQKK